VRNRTSDLRLWTLFAVNFRGYSVLSLHRRCLTWPRDLAGKLLDTKSIERNRRQLEQVHHQAQIFLDRGKATAVAAHFFRDDELSGRERVLGLLPQSA